MMSVPQSRSKQVKLQGYKARAVGVISSQLLVYSEEREECRPNKVIVSVLQAT